MEISYFESYFLAVCCFWLIVCHFGFVVYVDCGSVALLYILFLFLYALNLQMRVISTQLPVRLLKREPASLQESIHWHPFRSHQLSRGAKGIKRQLKMSSEVQVISNYVFLSRSRNRLTLSHLFINNSFPTFLFNFYFSAVTDIILQIIKGVGISHFTQFASAVQVSFD